MQNKLVFGEQHAANLQRRMRKMDLQTRRHIEILYSDEVFMSLFPSLVWNLLIRSSNWLPLSLVKQD